MRGVQGGLGLVAAGAVGVAGCGALGAAAPADAGPTTCAFKLATGLPCPLCGVTRSLLAVGGGDLERGFALAPVGPVVLVAAVVFLAVSATTLLRRTELRLPPAAAAAAGLVLAAGWAVQLATPANP